MTAGKKAEHMNSATPKADVETWGAVLERSIPQIYGMFVRKGLNAALAEELTSQTVFDAVCGRSSFNPAKGSMEGWLVGIARNNLALEMRKRANRPRMDGQIWEYLEAIDSEAVPDEVLERKETIVVVRAALSQLDDKEQAVLKAKYIEDLPVRVISEQMGITEKAVHSLLYRARNSLREKLKTDRPFV